MQRIRFIQCLRSVLAIMVVLTVGCSKQPGGGGGGRTAAEINANNHGVGLMGQFKYDEAVTVFQNLVDAHPNWLDAKVNLAIATLNRQNDASDEQRAIKLFDEVLAIDPDHATALYTSALLMRRTGEPEKMQQAFEHYTKVAEAHPTDAYAAYRVGACYRDDGEYETALEWFERSIENDPYMRSAYYGALQCLSRMGRPDASTEMLDIVNRLEHSPRLTRVKDIYTQMGPLAMAISVGLEERQPRPMPGGPLFADPTPLLSDSGPHSWDAIPNGRPASITACDIDSDGDLDIFIANAIADGVLHNAVIVNQGDDTFALDDDHPLAAIADVNAVLWGDYDNDGLTDVYLCRKGPNQLWRQTDVNTWENVTESTGTANGELDTVDGAFFDADHDSDLDVFCVNADGPNELLNNNLDGTFRAIAQEQGIAGDGRASLQVLTADLDSDRDVDIVVINDQPPHEVYLNDRLWSYRQAEYDEAFRRADIASAFAVDSAADGLIELVTHSSGAMVGSWRLTSGRVRSSDGNSSDELAERLPRLVQATVIDINGDGRLSLLRHWGSEWESIALGELPHVGLMKLVTESSAAAWAPITLDNSRGPSIVGLRYDGGGPVIWKPGPGRHDFVTLRFTGAEDKGAGPPPMRSNRSGIGVHIAARIDSTWTVTDTFRHHSGPGQSLQPIAIGLAGYEHIDYLELDWPDGVFQTEVHGIEPSRDKPKRDLTPGHVEVIDQWQRVTSSCPVLFVWDGEKFEFVSDLLGVGGMGYMVAPGEYAPPRPWENFALPLGMLQPRNGRYLIKVGEPMEEACYLDAARLVAYDLPPGWKMTLDERMGILGPEPTGAPIYYRTEDELRPICAANDRAEDVTATIMEMDLAAAPVGEIDHRFLGRLASVHVLELTFDRPIDHRQGDVHLLADGWIEYPYSQTMFGAWQARAEYLAPTIEAMNAEGEWVTILEQFGYPAGMPRQIAVALPNLPEGATKVRISTNQEIYWDRLSIIYASPCPEARSTTLAMRDARLQRTGFAARSTGPQRQPYYDYQDRPAFWDTRHMTGLYTEFGDVRELMQDADDALAIFGPGEEVHLEYEARRDPPSGWTRCFVLETNGWCKDMDLYTQHGETVGPVPAQSADVTRRDQLHERYNTRFESGR